jgi:hemoglobin/transferrin/lactoferrin receptor protein
MGMVGNGLRRLLCGVAAGSLSGTMALAQDGVASGKQDRVTVLQRLVVGAGVEKIAIDTPQAVTVIDQEEIDQEQATTIGDLFDTVPGVSVTGSDRIFGEAFNIRGIGALEAADESKIIITVDGAQKFYEQYRMGSLFTEPELYKRVEVLRGPASSTLYGSGALGGVINLTTKDAADFIADGQNHALRLKGGYETNGDGLLGSAIYAGRLSEHVELLATGIYRNSGEFVDGDGNPISGSAFDAWSGLLKGTVRFGEGNEQAVRLSYQRWQGDTDDQAYSQTGTLPFGTVDRFVIDETAVLSYENPASDNPWLDLKFSLSYSDTNNEQRDASSPSPSPLFLDTDYAYTTWSARLENTIEHRGERFENYLTLGTQLSHQDRQARALSGAGLDFHPEGTERRAGFYVQNEFILDDRLTLIPGARVDFVETRPDASIPGTTAKDDVAFSPKFAAFYEINDTLSIFGSVAHTERFPTIDELFSSSGPGRGGFPGGRAPSLGLEKETSNNFELGFALSGYDVFAPGDAVQLKTTGFYNDLNNLIAVNPDNRNPNPVPYFVNIDEARIYGVEVEAAYEADYVFARAALSIIEGEDTRTGQPLTTIPAHSLALTLGGRIPQHGLEFGWRAVFADEAESGVLGPTDAYHVHDVFASWRPEDGPLKGLEARFAVENVFDTQYRHNLAGDPGKGRTFKVSLARQLGW